ncbi:hypothetical protein RKD18_007971 [Streptomyces phaeoluteigriseus]
MAWGMGQPGRSALWHDAGLDKERITAEHLITTSRRSS